LKLPYELQIYKRGKDMLAPKELKEVHPLGKAPVISVQAEGGKPLVIAESAFIIEYLTDHFGSWLIPKRYEEGEEGQAGGETEEWLRYRFLMHYVEGSLMTYLIVALIVSSTTSRSAALARAS
jgi:glutathione S-transferase